VGPACAYVSKRARRLASPTGTDVFREAEHNLLALVDDALLLTQIGVADLGVASQPVAVREVVDGAVEAIGHGADLGLRLAVAREILSLPR
jgi:hypothetical protein